jgi:hypothetical protein
MADIVTSRIFADGEKNITATKLNDIVGSSVIQPAFVSAKPSTSTVAPTDNLLVLQAAGGAYAKAPFQTIIDSVNANLNTNAAIWSVRLRSFQALGNNTFEVDQRNVGVTVANPANGAFIQDRWFLNKTGTMVVSAGQQSISTGVNVPATSFAITGNFLRVTLTTAQATLGSSDQLMIGQRVEGSLWRELMNDVHSVSLLVRSSVASLNFGLNLRDGGNSRSLCKLCSLAAANTWTLIQLPNLPIWAAGGSYLPNPGTNAYILGITLAAGSANTTTANDTWQNSAAIGAIGQSSFAASPVNSTFDIAFVSHEPGPLCSNPPMDCPFTQNYDGCLRYYQKTHLYGVKPGTVSAPGYRTAWMPVASTQWFGQNAFIKVMAKTPTVTIWDPNTINASNAYSYNGSSSTGVTNVAAIGDSGYGYFASAGAPVAGSYALWHHVADTGW